MQTVVAEEVRDAMISKEIRHVDHHNCGACNTMVFYFRVEDQLYFNSNCECTRVFTPPRVCAWSDAADWINMQSKPEIKEKLAALFGIENKEKHERN